MCQFCSKDLRVALGKDVFRANPYDIFMFNIIVDRINYQ